MNTPKSEQIEFEVFPKNNKNDYSYLAQVKSDTSSGTGQINVVFSHQSVVIICICLLMSLVATFTLGVEKGKLLAKNTLASPAASAAATDTAVTATTKSVTTTNTVVAAATPTKDQSVVATPAAAPVLMVAETASTPVNSGYAIQVATVTTQNSAKSLADKLTKKGWPSYTKPSGKYVIVLAGNFAKQEEAKSRLRELKKTYTDCFIKKI